jgi:hypothetical protein
MTLLFLVLATLLAIVAAQLDSEQYTAVRTLLAGLGCTPPLCPFFACPSPVVCVSGRVTRLTVKSNRMGSIDGSSLGVLTDLQFVNLNGLSFLIPTQIGRLVALTQLYLYDSELTGTVPSQVGNLRSLTALNVHTNKLTGTLPALDMLTKLASLDTRNNVGLGGSMPALPLSTRSLITLNCSFTALPPNLSALTALTSLYVNQNKLIGPPPVVPSSLNVNGCTLQGNIAETNCFDCPANGTFGRCDCVRNTACASVPTITATLAVPFTFPPTKTTAGSAPATTPATSAVPPSVVLESSTASATSTTFAVVTNPTSVIEESTATVSTTLTTLEALTISTTSTPSSGTVEPWVIGVIVGSAILVLLLVGVVVFCLIKRRRAQQPPVDKPFAAEMKPAPSNYAQINVASSNYDQSWLNSNDEQPAPSNYAVIPAKSAGDYDSGRMDASDYLVGRLS